MDNIIVITLNLKLEALAKLKGRLPNGSSTLVISTFLIFENEAEIIKQQLGTDCTFINFSDILTDAEAAAIDAKAFNPNSQDSVMEYYQDIKVMKNEEIVKRVNEKYHCQNKIIVCDDLGIELDVWREGGFEVVECEYYNNNHQDLCPPRPQRLTIKKKFINVVKFILKPIFNIRYYTRKPAFVAYYNGNKYMFHGSTNRIGYRLDLDFRPANVWERFVYGLKCAGLYFLDENTIHISTFHEGYKTIPDHKSFNIKLMQDGYLPPNYSSNYLYFYTQTGIFYTWDHIGRDTFHYHHLPSAIIPFRKKLYLPKPNYPATVKKVLCVASGAGDWTAVKNRSDEDKMIYAFVQIAKMFPEIEFVYRCHPVWIHPLHQGVNSINRAADYFEYLNLPNLKISSHLPLDEANKGTLSFKRSSFEEDLKDVDIVFGEHSVSMIDAGFKKILFCSCNVTGRRNLFVGITELGFPHCESIEEIAAFIKSVPTEEFRVNYDNAIDNYNEMTDLED